MSEKQQLIRPYVVRGAVVTAAASISTGTNATLITGDADYCLDLVEISCSNNSTTAALVTIKDDGASVKTMSIPISGVSQLNFNVPIPQNKKAGNWTVDMTDVTGTTVNVEATFIKQ